VTVVQAPRITSSTGHEPESAPSALAPRTWTPWHKALAAGVVAYGLSRLFVLAGAGVATAAEDPRPPSAGGPMLDVLTSWDGRWYFEIVRLGYPHDVPPSITFDQLEARAAFFPLYPVLVRAVDTVLPRGDVLAGLALNVLLGLILVVLVGYLTRHLYGVGAARRAMILTALFPGSFVLSFTYSEALMLVLSAACLLLLLHERWWLAGAAAALATASRPNAVALIAACAVAAFIAIRRDRRWQALAAPLLAPIGLVAFHLFIGAHTGERGVWFRVQSEAWGEGLSFGTRALRDIGDAFAHPLSSPTRVLTLLCVVAMLAGIWAAWRVRLPWPLAAYTATILVLMLLPETVTARPRFLFTAFPLLIAVGAAWPEDRGVWREGWAFLLAACGAGLVAVVGLYGLIAAIP
jgi:hypothetical protein